MSNWFLWRLHQFSLWPAHLRMWLSSWIQYAISLLVCMSIRQVKMAFQHSFILHISCYDEVLEASFKATFLCTSFILFINIALIKLAIRYCNSPFQYKVKRLITGLARESSQYLHFYMKIKTAIAPYNRIINTHLKNMQCRAWTLPVHHTRHVVRIW